MPREVTPMMVRAEGSTRLSRFVASVLSAVVLVPAASPMAPAAAQMRTQVVTGAAGTPVTPVVMGQQPGALVLSPGVAARFSNPVGLTATTVLPATAIGRAAQARTAAATNAGAQPVAAALKDSPGPSAPGAAPAAQPLASGIQVIAADAPVPHVRGGAPMAPAATKDGAPAAMDSALAAANPQGGDVAFDGMGIRKSDKVHHPELNLDQRPEAPKAQVGWSEIHVPTKAQLKGGLLNKIKGWVLGPDEAVILPGSPQDSPGVERALRELIRSKPELFSNLTPDQFRTLHVRKVIGKAGLADTFYANFQQQKDTLAVEGSYLNFVVKILGDKTVVVGSNAELFPETASVDTSGRLEDLELRRKASERLGTPPNAGSELRDLDRKVMFVGGQWRAVQVYFYEKMMVMVAVDVTTGETFAWDPRMHAAPNAKAEGRGVAEGPFDAKAPLDVMELGHLEIQGPTGKFYADAEGRFTVPGTGTEPVELKMRLTGRWADVRDQDRKDLVVTVKAKPGEELRVVFNPEGMDEGAVAQINGYVHTTRVHDWIVKQGIDLQGLNRAIQVNVNINDDCNAYYTPWNPTLNFFKKSSRCANSSFGNVNYHEYGHFIDDMAGGIKNGGLSEGWGDIVAMYMGGKPEIGKGFFISNPWDPTKPPPPYLRNGVNDYQYNPRDEVHDQGLAWMGFGWQLREALMKTINPAEGAALAEALVIPVFLASVRDIPSAIQQVLLRDIGADGKSEHFEQIRSAAAKHGIK
ncbi:MAG: hypothetical protein HY553_01495, partial [Elusimicrobia bacterium]|nr:hypothetical protein [Elusimicrobiota bacterium]